MSNKIKPGLSISQEVWEEFKKKTRGASSSVIEEFMKSYPDNSEETANIPVNKEILNKIQNKFGADTGNFVNTALDNYSCYSEPKHMKSENVNSLILQGGSWSVAYKNGNMTLSNSNNTSIDSNDIIID